MSEREGSVVLPLVVQDGKHFSDWLGKIQVHRLEGVLTGAPAFRSSHRYLEFVEGVQRLCDGVETALSRAPPWSKDFPLVGPAPLEPAAVPLPRFL